MFLNYSGVHHKGGRTNFTHKDTHTNPRCMSVTDFKRCLTSCCFSLADSIDLCSFADDFQLKLSRNTIRESFGEVLDIAGTPVTSDDVTVDFDQFEVSALSCSR